MYKKLNKNTTQTVMYHQIHFFNGKNKRKIPSSERNLKVNVPQQMSKAVMSNTLNEYITPVILLTLIQAFSEKGK